MTTRTSVCGKKSLKISEGCKHEGESCGIKGTARSTGFRAGTFPCCLEQWMGDNWEAENHHHDYISLKPVPLWHDLSHPTPACDWHQDLSHWNTAWKQNKATKYFPLHLIVVTPNTWDKLEPAGINRTFPMGLEKPLSPAKCHLSL